MNRLLLKNVPLYLTKQQILNLFFPDLEDIEIQFTKRNDNTQNGRNILIELKTRNEAILCVKFINRLECFDVQASVIENKSVSSITKENVNQCAFCLDINPEFMCNDCSTLYFATYYCCKDHQEKDWNRHKVECRSLPDLRRVNEFKAESVNGDHTDTESDFFEDDQSNKKSKYFIKVVEMKPSCKVVITSMINSRLLYIRQICPESNDLVNKISQYSDTAPMLPEKPVIGEYVLVPYKNSYQRAKVLELFDTDQNGFNARVSLTDVGSELMLKWQEMKLMNYKIRGRPSYTQKVILNDITNEKSNRNVDSFLQKLMFDKEVLEVVDIFGNQINGLKVVLKQFQTGVIINDVVNCMLSDARVEKYFYDVSKVPKFSTRSELKIFIADCSQLENQNLLSCIPNEKLNDYLLMLDELRKYCKRIPNEPYETLAFNEMCIVKYDGQWYRASCSDNKMEGDCIKFILIDLMINVQIMKSDIRKIPQSFSQHFYTSLCYVEGINEGNVKKIKEIIKTEKFIRACVKYDSQTKCPVLNNLFY